MCTSQVGAEYARAWEGVVSVVVGWWWGCWVKMLRNHSGGQAQRCMRAVLPWLPRLPAAAPPCRPAVLCPGTHLCAAPGWGCRG